MPERTAPYPAYNFIVNLNGPRDPEKLLGGFSDVSGLSTEIHFSEYRDGNEPEAHVRKIAGTHKNGDVTLRRGLVDPTDLRDWIVQTQTTGVLAQRDVVITLRDEANNPVLAWKLRNAAPSSWKGPVLAGKGGGEVAMEELVLCIEGFEIVPAQ